MSKQPTDGPLDAEKKELSIAVTAAENFEEQVEQVGKVTPPDGGYGWVVVAASFLVNMCVDGVIYTGSSTIAEPLAKKFGGSVSAASLVFAILTGFYYFCGPLAAAVVNVFGVRPVAMVGGLLTATAFCLCSLVNQPYEYYLLFGVLGGIGFGCMYLPSIVILSTYFDKKRSMATGIAVCGSGIGTVIFSQLNVIVFPMMGESVSTFMIYLAGIAACGSLFSLLFKPLSPSEKQVTKVAKMVREYEGKNEEPTQRLLENVRNDLEELNKPGHNADTFAVADRSRTNTLDKKGVEAAKHIIHATEDHHVEHVVKKSKFAEFKDSLCACLDKELLLSPSFMTLAVSGTFTVMAFLVPFNMLKMAMHPSITDQGQRALPLTLIGVFNIVFRIVCGIISDHPKMSALQVSNIAQIVAGASMMFVPYCTELWHYVIFCIPFSAGVACFAALRSVICVELIGVEKLNNAFGIMMVFMGIGATTGGPIAGFIKEFWGSFDYAFYLMGGIFAFSGIMTIRLSQMKAWEDARKARRQGTEMRVLSQS